MGERKNILEKIAVATDLRSEPLLKQSLVEIIGQRRVLIENHCGIIGYGKQEICVKVRTGKILVCGNCLEIVQMTREQLIILGSIDEIRLLRGGI